MPERSAWDKIQWLITHPEFRKQPIRVLTRVAYWEKVRRSGRATELKLGRWRILCRPNDGFGRLLCYFGEEAEEMFSFFHDYLKPGMTMVDVGSNIGTHCIYAAGLVGPTGRVHAVEPEPETIALLNYNISHNGLANVKVHETCAANETGVLRLHINVDSAKTSLIGDSDVGIDVPADRLDHILPAGINIDLLKIDAEGADYDVLLGSSGLFDAPAPRVVVIEALERFCEVSNFLTSRGYSLFTFERSDTTLREFTDQPANTYAVHESVALKRVGPGVWRLAEERPARVTLAS